MKVIIAGGRDFKNYELLKEKVDFILSKCETKPEIVSGKAEGADALGEIYSREELGTEATAFPAKWDDLTHPDARIKENNKGRYDANAGKRRNREMAGYADMLICFWNGESGGSRDMIDQALKLGLEVHVFPYESNIMPFGKHKGLKFDQVPADYMVWMHENGNRLTVPLRKFLNENIDSLRKKAKEMAEQQ